MSDTAQATIDLRPATDDMQTRASEMVLFLLGLAHMKKQDLAPVLGIAPSGVGRAIAGGRRWTLDDLAAMSFFFTDRLGRNVGPGIFFRTVDEVLDHQNWK